MCSYTAHLLLGAAATLPLAAQRWQPVPLRERYETLALALGDIDGDGDLDLVCGNFGPSRVLINAGHGEFTDETRARLPVFFDQTNRVVLFDSDKDGDLDLFAANGGWPGGSNRLYHNDGAGRFTLIEGGIPNYYEWANDATCGDVDGDGDLDLLLANFNRSRLLLNDGKGRFSDGSEARLPADLGVAMAIALGDLDGDGDLDLVLGNSLYQQNRIYRNDGHGKFAAAPCPPDHDDTVAIALGDVDTDGDLDIVFGNSAPGGQVNRLWLNDGRGGFARGSLPDEAAETTELALIDLDRDGHLDLVCATGGKPHGGVCRLLFNDGHGALKPRAEVTLPLPRRNWTALAVGDVDGDGVADLVLGSNAYRGSDTVVLRWLREPAGTGPVSPAKNDRDSRSR